MKSTPHRLLSLLFVVITAGEAQAKPPNVLFVVIDDLRPALGCLGDPIAKTPHIDRLAKQGIVFERAYCQQAVCSPSRLSLLTGRRPDSIRVWDLKTHFRAAAPDAVTLPQHFRNNGYHTQSIGKIFHGGGKPAKDPPSWSVEPLYDVTRDQNLRYALPKNLRKKGLKQASTESADVPDETYLDGLVCREAERTLAKLRDSKKPFFLAVGFRKPHLPFCAPKKYWDLYDRSAIPLPTTTAHPKGAPELAVRSWKELEGYTDIPPDGVIPKAKVRELRHGYYACVSYVDALVGRLLNALARHQLNENTLVVLLGDHGFHLGEQGLWTKANNYELSTRVPLLLSMPGQKKRGIRTTAFVELVDLYPTLAELCGLNPPKGVEGISLAPLLTDPNRPWKKAAFSQYPRAKTGHRHSGPGDIMGYAVRTGRYRYVEWKDWRTRKIRARELYDHERDPHEARNLADRAEHKQTVASLSGMLARGWRAALPKNRTKPTRSKPNVLFLAVDDMNDWVGCLNGYPGKVRTPNIDRLAKQGVLFTNAHCASPKCAPSRAAILTGLRPSTTGLYDNGHWWLPNLPTVVSLPAYFSKHGYRVVGAGKIFHHTAGNNPPSQWDDFHRLTFRNDPWFRTSKKNYPWSKSSPPPKGFPFGGVEKLGHENDWGSLDIPESDYDDALSADYAIRFLKQKQSRPFFLACGIFRPHLPWYVPKKFFDMYPLDEVVLPKVRADDLNDIPAVGRQLAKARESDLLTIRKAGKWKHAVRAYLASISYADAQLGRILDTLEASPHAKNTIVVLWSDHGWHLGEKGHWYKSTLWEEATRVPLVIRAPGHRPGVCDRPVNLVDLFPTLNDLCRFAPIDTHDGISLAPLLRDPSAKWDRPSVTEFRRGNASVRSLRYRYIRYHDGGDELYDHRTDPNEWSNLADDPKHAPIVRELSKWLPKKWAKSAPTKSAFVFDPHSFTWTNKKTGKKTHGKKP